MEFWSAVGIFALLGSLILLKKMGVEDYTYSQPSRWDCAELDQDHILVKGRCTICGKNFCKN